MPEENGANRLHNNFQLYAATKDDLDDLTRIHRDGFIEEPQVHYCYPLRGEYPKDYWRWTREEYNIYLEHPYKYKAHVLEAPDEFDGRIVMKPVGLAAWDLGAMVQTPNTGTLNSLCPTPQPHCLVLMYALTDPGFNKRRDANKKHCDAFIEAVRRRFKTHFAIYHGRQFNLSTPVMHPDFRRRGAGTMLVNWGIMKGEAVRSCRWPVTLCASPINKMLYDHVKFREIATEVVRVEGEEETVTSSVMVYGGPKA